MSKCLKRVKDDLPNHEIDALKSNLSRDLSKLEHFDLLIYNMCSEEETDSELEQTFDYKLKVQGALFYLDFLKSKSLIEETPSESASAKLFSFNCLLF